MHNGLTEQDFSLFCGRSELLLITGRAQSPSTVQRILFVGASEDWIPTNTRRRIVGNNLQDMNPVKIIDFLYGEL